MNVQNSKIFERLIRRARRMARAKSAASARDANANGFPEAIAGSGERIGSKKLQKSPKSPFDSHFISQSEITSNYGAPKRDISSDFDVIHDSSKTKRRKHQQSPYSGNIQGLHFSHFTGDSFGHHFLNGCESFQPYVNCDSSNAALCLSAPAHHDRLIPSIGAILPDLTWTDETSSLNHPAQKTARLASIGSLLFQLRCCSADFLPRSSNLATFSPSLMPSSGFVHTMPRPVTASSSSSSRIANAANTSAVFAAPPRRWVVAPGIATSTIAAADAAAARLDAAFAAARRGVRS